MESRNLHHHYSPFFKGIFSYFRIDRAWNFVSSIRCIDYYRQINAVFGVLEWNRLIAYLIGWLHLRSFQTWILLNYKSVIFPEIINKFTEKSQNIILCKTKAPLWCNCYISSFLTEKTVFTCLKQKNLIVSKKSIRR